MVQSVPPQMLSTSKGLATVRPVTDVRLHNHGGKFRATDTVVFADGIPRSLQSESNQQYPIMKDCALKNIKD